MDFGAVATAIAGAMDSVSGITVYDYVPDAIVPPCATVVLEGAEYRAVMADKTEATASYRVTVYGRAGAPRDGLMAVYGYASPTGASSIVAALDADPDLSLSGHSATVTSLDTIDRVTADDGGVYYVAGFTVEVMG